MTRLLETINGTAIARHWNEILVELLGHSCSCDCGVYGMGDWHL